MIARFHDVAGIVLAGGGSRRMGGVPKAMITVGGVRILDRILAVMRPLFSEILVVANEAAPFAGIDGVRVVTDAFRGCGPMGGIHAGLKAMSRRAGFFAACDMPFLDPALVARVCRLGLGEAVECAVPCSHRGLEPLHALYGKEALPAFEASLRRGEFRIRRAVGACRCVYVGIRGAQLDAVYNVNCPDDLAGAEGRERPSEAVRGEAAWKISQS